MVFKPRHYSQGSERLLYFNTGMVSTSLPKLYASYVELLLKSGETGNYNFDGLQFALRHLARETHLRSGGDRGLTIERSVKLLGEIGEVLKKYNIQISPIELIALLCRAGLYRRNGDRLRLFHDSFESYFAARALESHFDNKEFDTKESVLFRQCKDNSRLEETWWFLREILAERGEWEVLENAMAAERIKPVDVPPPQRTAGDAWGSNREWEYYS